MMKTSNLHPSEESALLAAGDRIGSHVRGNHLTLAALKGKGLIDSHLNLTEDGQIQRTAISERKMDEAFGA